MAKTTTSKIITHIEEGLDNSYSYTEYIDLVDKLLQEGKSTTKDAGEEMTYYSKLGLQRMIRWNKRFELSGAQEKTIASYDKETTWVVLSEGWCGDAAHCLPIINKVAAANDKINLRIVLREENPELMNDFLTNGGKSIPKLIAYNPSEKTVIGTWGPRPEPAQNIFLSAKENNVDFETYERDLQMWYNKDKGQTVTKELLDLLK